MESAIANISSDPRQTTDTLSLIGQANKAASDELRLLILHLLKNDSFGVLELCGLLDLAQSKLSHHLKVLLNAGLVATRREGNTIFYCRSVVLADDPLSTHIAGLYDILDTLELAPELAHKTDMLKQSREEKSLAFFDKFSDKFTEQQALIVERNQYTPNLLGLVSALRLDTNARVIEVGPGDGELLCALATQFDEVLGIDNSSAMLTLARHNAKKKNANNIRLIEADATQTLNNVEQADLVICDMVLHHLASPSAAIKRLAQLVKSKGHLLIADLALHSQEWVKKSCGDLWLGFSTEELMHWAESAGLHSRQSSFLSLRNGFQVQLHLYQH